MKTPGWAGPGRDAVQRVQHRTQQNGGETIGLYGRQSVYGTATYAGRTARYGSTPYGQGRYGSEDAPLPRARWGYSHYGRGARYGGADRGY